MWYRSLDFLLQRSRPGSPVPPPFFTYKEGFGFVPDGRFIHPLLLLVPTTCSDYLYRSIGNSEESLSETAKNRGGESIGNSVENSPDSHKPVEIRDLRVLAIRGSGAPLEVRTGPPRP